MEVVKDEGEVVCCGVDVVDQGRQGGLNRLRYAATAEKQTRGAVKLHTLLDLRGPIPSFLYLSDGKLHDVKVLDLLIPQPGAFYIMDRAYLDFARLYGLDQAGSFFVTRAKRNMNARRLYSAAVDRSTGLICVVGTAMRGRPEEVS